MNRSRITGIYILGKTCINNEPNVVVEWLTLLLRIREAPGSNLGPVTSYLMRFSWLSEITPGKCQNSALKLGYDRFLPNRFQFIVQLSPFHLTSS
jgi:hypothetical protein